jgi:hypothetical protein
MKIHELDESYNSYHNNRTGFGRRERDMSDESNLLYIYKNDRVHQAMISNRVEQEARAQGYRDTPEQALKVHNIIRSKFDPKKWVQNQGGKWVVVHPYGETKDISESDAISTTTSGNIATLPNPTQAHSKKKVKSVSALDQDEVSLFGGPMENIKAPIIKRR